LTVRPSRGLATVLAFFGWERAPSSSSSSVAWNSPLALDRREPRRRTSFSSGVLWVLWPLELICRMFVLEWFPARGWIGPMLWAVPSLGINPLEWDLSLQRIRLQRGLHRNGWERRRPPVVGAQIPPCSVPRLRSVLVLPGDNLEPALSWDARSPRLVVRKAAEGATLALLGRLERKPIRRSHLPLYRLASSHLASLIRFRMTHRPCILSLPLLACAWPAERRRMPWTNELLIVLCISIHFICWLFKLNYRLESRLNRWHLDD
jgi:hypothetical protein